MIGEFNYYSALSGLVPVQNYSLSDHKYAYFKGVSGLVPWQTYSLADHMMAFYRAQVVGQPYWTLSDYEYAYFAGLAGGANGRSIADLKAIVFVTPPLVELRRNFAVNPSIEVASTSWAPDSATVTKSTLQQHHGTSALRVAPSLALGGTRINFTPPAIGDYTASVWVFSDLGPRSISLSCGTQVTTVISAGVWTKMSLTFNRASLAVASVYVSSVDTSDTYYVDELLIEAGTSVGTYFDGDSPNCEWLGTPGLSASRLMG